VSNVTNLDTERKRKTRAAAFGALSDIAEFHKIDDITDMLRALLDVMEDRGLGDTAYAYNGWTVSITKTT
jgi:hypothetical protein